MSWKDWTPLVAVGVAVVSLLVSARKNSYEQKKDVREVRIDLLEQRSKACEEQRAIQQQEILQLRKDVSHLNEQNVRLMKMLLKEPAEQDN